MHRLKDRRLLVALVLLVAVSCAARGPRNRTQVASLAVADAVLSVDAAERQVYAANIQGYAKADHDRVGGAILKLLYASRGFERAAGSWAEGVDTPPEALTSAEAALVVAFSDVQMAVPAVGPARDPIVAALATARAALETWRANR